MKALIGLMLLFAVIVVIAKKIKVGGGEEGKAGLTYFKKKLLTQPEQALYYKLRQALPKNNVLAQVSLSALIGIKKGKGWQAAFNKTSRKYVDFVICTPAFDVVAVIELDDSTHMQGKRIKADAEKEIALEGAGIRVVRWWINEVPSGEEIAALFAAEKLHTPPST